MASKRRDSIESNEKVIGVEPVSFLCGDDDVVVQVWTVPMISPFREGQHLVVHRRVGELDRHRPWMQVVD